MKHVHLDKIYWLNAVLICFYGLAIISPEFEFLVLLFFPIGILVQLMYYSIWDNPTKKWILDILSIIKIALFLSQPIFKSYIVVLIASTVVLVIDSYIYSIFKVKKEFTTELTEREKKTGKRKSNMVLVISWVSAGCMWLISITSHILIAVSICMVIKMKDVEKIKRQISICVIIFTYFISILVIMLINDDIKYLMIFIICLINGIMQYKLLKQ